MNYIMLLIHQGIIDPLMNEQPPIMSSRTLYACAVLWCILCASSTAFSSDDAWQRRLNQSFSNALSPVHLTTRSMAHATPRHSSRLSVTRTLPGSSTPEHSQQQRFDFLTNALRRQNEIVTPWQIGWTGAYLAGTLKSAHSRNTAQTDQERVKSNINLGNSLLALGAQLTKDRFPGLNDSFTNASHNLSTRIKNAEQLLYSRAQHTQTMHSFNDKLITYGISALTSAVMWDKVSEKDAIANFGLSLIGIEVSRRSLSNQAIIDWNTYQSMRSQESASTLDLLTQYHQPLHVSINPINTRINLEYRF